MLCNDVLGNYKHFLFCFIFRAKQEVQLAKNIKLLDCPGVVMATGTSETAMVLRNCVKVRNLPNGFGFFTDKYLVSCKACSV